MTCIEKLRELHPDWDDEKVEYYVGHRCPMREYIHQRPINCGAHGWEDSDDIDCEKCWNREVYEDETYNKHHLSQWMTGEDMRRLRKLEERLGCSVGTLIAAALKTYEDGLNAIGFNMEVKDDE